MVSYARKECIARLLHDFYWPREGANIQVFNFGLIGQKLKVSLQLEF